MIYEMIKNKLDLQWYGATLTVHKESGTLR